MASLDVLRELNRPRDTLGTTRVPASPACRKSESEKQEEKEEKEISRSPLFVFFQKTKTP
jgi:hypothetical protein